MLNVIELLNQFHRIIKAIAIGARACRHRERQSDHYECCERLHHFLICWFSALTAGSAAARRTSLPVRLTFPG